MTLKPEYGNGLCVKGKSGTRKRRKMVLGLKLGVNFTFFFKSFGE
jgi:hypothetical protein